MHGFSFGLGGESYLPPFEKGEKVVRRLGRKPPPSTALYAVVQTMEFTTKSGWLVTADLYERRGAGGKFAQCVATWTLPAALLTKAVEP